MTKSARPPSPRRILEISEGFSIHRSRADAESFAGILAGSVAGYTRLDELLAPRLPTTYLRIPDWRSEPG